MGQARFGSNGEVGHIIKNEYNPTLEQPKRFTRSDKQLAAGGAAALAGGGYIRSANRLPKDAAAWRRNAVANVKIANNELAAQKAKAGTFSRLGNRPVNWGFDRDRPGGPIKNLANRRRYGRQTPKLESAFQDAKKRVNIAVEAAKPENIKTRQLRMRGVGGALATGGGYLAYRGLKNRKIEQQAGMR